MTSSLRRCGDIALNVSEYGPAGGPLVILLHGFPDFSLAWSHQAPALVAAGYRVVVPDQRGYNLSDKPRGIASYDLGRLAVDVIALAASYGEDRFAVVGHDWGASVAWWLADKFPQHVRRAAMINAPHPAIWRDAMQNDPRQRRLSSYVRILALPWLPELILRAGHYKALADSIRTSRDTLSKDTMAAYRAAWSQTGALTGMINWYRALLKRQFSLPAAGHIAPPSLVIWGKDDAFAIAELAERSAALCAKPELHLLDGAGHWAMRDQPEMVNRLLLEFLDRG